MGPVAQVLWHSFPELCHVGAVLVIVAFMVAIMGSALYGDRAESFSSLAGTLCWLHMYLLAPFLSFLLVQVLLQGVDLQAELCGLLAPCAAIINALVHVMQGYSFQLHVLIASGLLNVVHLSRTLCHGSP